VEFRQVDVTPSICPLAARLVSESGVEEAYGALILSILERAVAEGGGQRAITLLPALTCEGHGGDVGGATPVCAAWLLVRLAAKLLDDVEDRDLDDEQPLQVNASTGLLALAHLAIDALAVDGVPATRVADLSVALQRAILRAAGGQHRDLLASGGAVGQDPDGWLAIAAAKSGALFGWAAWAGAAMAGAEGDRLESYRRFGEHLGVLLQVADDYNDIWAPAAEAGDRAEPPALGAANLSIAYGRLVADDAVRGRLDDALRSALEGVTDAREAVVDAVTGLGAQTFVLAAARAQRQLAVEALDAAGARPAAARRLVALLDGIMPALRVVADVS